MRVRLEEVACLVVAFALFVGHVIMIAVIDLMSFSEQSVHEGVLHIGGSTVLSFIGLIAVFKIPGSWWFRIVYDSTEKNEDMNASTTVGHH